jgi:hypothetical protein
MSKWINGPSLGVNMEYVAALQIETHPILVNGGSQVQHRLVAYFGQIPGHTVLATNTDRRVIEDLFNQALALARGQIAPATTDAVEGTVVYQAKGTA